MNAASDASRTSHGSRLTIQFLRNLPRTYRGFFVAFDEGTRTVLLPHEVPS